MKLLIALLLLAGSAVAQDQSRLRIIVTDPDGTEHIAKITGAPAASGLDIIKQWLVTQQTCATPPDGCTPKYANGAEFVKALVLDKAEEFARQGFVSAALKPDADELKAKAAALEAKRKAAFDAARAEK